MIAYYNGEFLPLEKIYISPFDRGFLFADGVYETLRTYNRKLFMSHKHFERLKYSAEQIEIHFSDYNKLENIIYHCAELNSMNTEFSAYIQITRGVSFPRTHHYQKQIKANLFIYVSELNNQEDEKKEGVTITLEKDIRWSRCDIKSIALLPNVLANNKAFKNGHYEALFFRDNFITEGSHTNFFAVKNETVFTTPLSSFILNGVTRNIIIQLCKEDGILVKEENIPVKNIFNYDELFITGTLTEIAPVIKIDEHPVGNGKPGKMTRRIQELFYDFVGKY
jgi:D-alanine transaminase